MKILYAIQGTGNGHVSRARDIIPILQTYGELDLLISGTQSDVDLPYEIKYRFHGLCFVFGKKGGIDYVETCKRSNIKKLFAEIRQLPVHEYDIVISDFEPVSAWACYIKNKHCIGLSHQLAVINKNAPKPSKTDVIGKLVLKYYAPVKFKYSFHFLPYNNNIFTPVIRREIRELEPENLGHYTVYLPSYSDRRIIKFLKKYTEAKWHVFSKHSKEGYKEDGISIFPVNNEAFIKSVEGAAGVFCGAGFETPAEVIYLRKKLIVIPMKGQYEQQCNAAALKMLGFPVLKSLKLKHQKKFEKWMGAKNIIQLDFPNETELIIQTIMENHAQETRASQPPEIFIDSASGFRHLLLNKIFNITR